jgi:hypothetical protein
MVGGSKEPLMLLDATPVHRLKQLLKEWCVEVVVCLLVVGL